MPLIAFNLICSLNRSTGEFRILTRQRSTGGGNVQVMRLNEGFCSCGKMDIYKYSCSHVLTATTYQGSDPFRFLAKEYQMEFNVRAWEGLFHPMAHEDYWPQHNLPMLLPNDATRHVIRPGCPKSARIHNEMDQHSHRVPKQCSICKELGHDRRRCPARPRS